MDEWSMEHCLSDTDSVEPQCAKQKLCQCHFVPDHLTMTRCLRWLQHHGCNCSGVLSCNERLQIAVVAGVTLVLIYFIHIIFLLFSYLIYVLSEKSFKIL